jgi:hypothetical protein
MKVTNQDCGMHLRSGIAYDTAEGGPQYLFATVMRWKN